MSRGKVLTIFLVGGVVTRFFIQEWGKHQKKRGLFVEDLLVYSCRSSTDPHLSTRVDLLQDLLVEDLQVHFDSSLNPTAVTCCYLWRGFPSVICKADFQLLTSMMSALSRTLELSVGLRCRQVMIGDCSRTCSQVGRPGWKEERRIYRAAVDPPFPFLSSHSHTIAVHSLSQGRR